MAQSEHSFVFCFPELSPILNNRKPFQELSQRQKKRHHEGLREFVKNKLRKNDEEADFELVNALNPERKFIRQQVLDHSRINSSPEILTHSNIKKDLDCLVKKRRRYTSFEKTIIVSAFTSAQEELRLNGIEFTDGQIIHSILQTIRVNDNYLYENLTEKTISKWLSQSKERKISIRSALYRDFQQKMLEKLIISEYDKSSNQYKIVHNVIYSYDIIRLAGQAAQKDPMFDRNLYSDVPSQDTCDYIKSLKLSNKFCKSFLHRNGLHRRRTTRKATILPSLKEIEDCMKTNQKRYLEGDFTPKTCLNFDETAYTYSIGPSNQYVPEDCSRAEHIEGDDDKARITAVLASNGIGESLPTMIIVKHSAKTVDETGVRVLKTLQASDDFKDWEFKSFDGPTLTDKHKLYFLQNKDTKDVIVSQHKAWMDESKMAMYHDLILKPYKERMGKLMVYQDNCPSHVTDFIKDLYKKSGIIQALLPPNTTAIFQVLDLIVNGPLKAHTRRIRAERTFQSFQEYLGFVEGASSSSVEGENTQVPHFAVAKPTMNCAIIDLFNLTKEDFTKESFKASVNRSFIETGMIPDPETNSFRSVQESIAKELSKGTMKTDAGAVKVNFTFDDDEDEDDVDNDIELESESASDTENEIEREN